MITENDFYKRHLMLPEVGLDGQKKLKNSSILVVGAGGLGCPVLQYLATAGVGRIGIIDHDYIDASNLHRQILFTINDIKKSKALVAAEKLTTLNPFIKVEAHDKAFSINNALELIENYDLVIDGSDNFSTKFLINDSAVICNKPMVYGSISQFDGQLCVFNYAEFDEEKLNLRDVFPEPPPEELRTSCSGSGVLGVLPGMIGTFMANEALKVLLGIGKVMSREMILFEALQFTIMKIKLKVNSKNPLRNGVLALSKLVVDVGDICEFPSVNEVTFDDFKGIQSKGEDLILIDVRSPSEHLETNIGGVNVQTDDVENFLQNTKLDTKIILYCTSGTRSKKVVTMLSNKLPNRVFFSLKGGILSTGKIVI